MQTVTRGIVIRAKTVGDDRLLTLLTEDCGVISATARGAAKPRSAMASASEQFCYGRMTLFRYRDHTALDAVDLEQSFFALRADLTALALACYIAELCGELCPREEQAEEYLRLLLNTLHLLSKKKRPVWQLKPLFELRLLTMAGFMPDLTGCAGCGVYEREDGADFFFSAGQGALYCPDCCLPEYSAVPLPGGVLAAMRHIVYSPFERLFAFSLPEQGLYALTAVCESYLKYHLQRSYPSLDFFYAVAS